MFVSVSLNSVHIYPILCYVCVCANFMISALNSVECYSNVIYPGIALQKKDKERTIQNLLPFHCRDVQLLEISYVLLILQTCAIGCLFCLLSSFFIWLKLPVNTCLFL